MRRRRRPDKEIHFSFDSFLDVVANVVGIIIKLILVAWVGARTYKGFEIPESFAPNTQNVIRTSSTKHTKSHYNIMNQTHKESLQNYEPDT